jgi:hypothetical protein
MDKMQRIRGQIHQDDQLVLDQVDGYLNCHERQGRQTFYGFFEMLTERAKLLNPAICYRLTLADGRKCNFYAEIVPSNTAGNSVAEFHVTGGFKK